ncbi:MAG TPA: HXXEE domain-containing protein [Pyrinomonadaceae bacterium]|nr:HXXEE domain-containing protein [Pyrinomonadaceae bacterium]
MITGGILNLIVPALIAIISIVIFFLVHPAQKLSFVPAMVVAFVCYLRTSYREMPKAERVLPIYLVALAIQFLHFTEEYVYGFQFRVTEIMAGMPPFNANVFLAFNMIAYSLFLLAGIGMYKRMKFPMIIVWFFAICVMGNAIWHLLLTLKVGGYFPGLYTSFAGWILGPILLRRLWSRENIAPAS